MDAILNALFSFPTAIFSVALAVAMSYWLLVILGAFDIDLFHFGDHDVGHDAGHDHDGGTGHNGNAILEFLRVGQVPMTILGSFFVVIGWVVCLAAGTFARPLLPDWSWWLFGSISLALAVVAAFVGTGLCAAPLAAVFKVKGNFAADDLVGKVVVVTSSTVDQRFGQARHDRPSGEDLVLNVVCEPHHRLVRDDQAVIMSYDKAAGIYHIAPLPHTKPGFLAEGEAPAPQPTGQPVADPQRLNQ